MEKEKRSVTVIVPRNSTMIKYVYLIVFLVHFSLNVAAIVRVGQIRCHINSVSVKEEQNTQNVNTTLNCLIVAFIVHQLLGIIGFFTHNLASLVCSIMFNISWFSVGIFVSSAKINGLTSTVLDTDLPRIVPIAIGSTVFSFLAIVSTMMFVYTILSKRKSWKKNFSQNFLTISEQKMENVLKWIFWQKYFRWLSAININSWMGWTSCCFIGSRTVLRTIFAPFPLILFFMRYISREVLELRAEERWRSGKVVTSIVDGDSKELLLKRF